VFESKASEENKIIGEKTTCPEAQSGASQIQDANRVAMMLEA
jgi:hypothetical protein